MIAWGIFGIILFAAISVTTRRLLNRWANKPLASPRTSAELLENLRMQLDAGQLSKEEFEVAKKKLVDKLRTAG